ncbi:MAG: hypothetical protein KDJ45_16370 [Hyphomicrobiaceae bacterium]|nr:hypothetical protein [Hyphomicrobiaceae bacterium]MCC0009150.1 hypothetical protein [Hyphomicrobiaceae bacterium]
MHHLSKPLNRRSLCTMLCGCAAAACFAPARSALAWTTTVQKTVDKLAKIKGCFVDSNNANLLLGANMVAGSNAHLPSEVKTMLRSTGNADLDRAFDSALQRLAETFDVWPKVGFYDDSDAPNAMAMRYAVGGTHEFAVVFGRNYFKTLMSYDPSGITLLQTAAHEFAHVWVYQRGLFETIRGGQPTVKRVELHADFLSGYYLGVRKRDNPNASFWSAGMRRWESGDNQLRNMHHHGTPDDRLAAAEAGFKAGFIEKLSAPQAFDAATQYVAKV